MFQHFTVSTQCFNILPVFAQIEVNYCVFYSVLVIAIFWTEFHTSGPDLK